MNNKGVTLIALVITIIVLVIVGGVSVYALLGNDGILTKSQEASNKDYLESTKEEIKLQISEEIATNEGTNPTNEVLKSILEKYGQVEYDVDGVTVKGVVTTKNGYEILLSDLGTLSTSSVETQDTATISYAVTGISGSTYNILVKIGDPNGIEKIIYKNSSGEDVTLTCDDKQEVDIDYTAIQDTDYYFTIFNKVGAKIIKDLHFEVTVNEFPYTGNVQTFTISRSGNYELEVWGASAGGKGGYSKGEMQLQAGQTVYIYVGGSNGFNQVSGGGGNAGNGALGAGGTDIRISGQALSNRVIVAGGGGCTGSDSYRTHIFGNGGAGGGLNGISGGDASVISAYGAAGSGASPGGNKGGNGGSGSGYSTYSGDYWYAYGGGGGGSAYIGGVQNGSTIAGNSSFLSPTGITETGHSGNGYAKIKFEQ